MVVLPAQTFFPGAVRVHSSPKDVDFWRQRLTPRQRDFRTAHYPISVASANVLSVVVTTKLRESLVQQGLLPALAGTVVMEFVADGAHGFRSQLQVNAAGFKQAIDGLRGDEKDQQLAFISQTFFELAKQTGTTLFWQNPNWPYKVSDAKQVAQYLSEDGRGWEGWTGIVLHQGRSGQSTRTDDTRSTHPLRLAEAVNRYCAKILQESPLDLSEFEHEAREHRRFHPQTPIGKMKKWAFDKAFGELLPDRKPQPQLEASTPANMEAALIDGTWAKKQEAPCQPKPHAPHGEIVMRR